MGHPSRKDQPKQGVQGQPSEPRKPSRLKQSLLSLEPRLMFDAAAAATAAEVRTEQVAQEQAEAAVSSPESAENQTQESSDGHDLLQAISTFMPNESRTEVVFVDPTVPNYRELLGGMDPNIEVIMLDGGTDGIEQMASALSGRTGIDAIHLISHGDAGALQLGTGTLNAESMSSQYVDELATIQQALSEQADILVYGCDFAEGETGQAAVDQLALLTGADVLASNDLTGNVALGGDWDLEVKTGSIETQVVVADETQMNWIGVLAETWMDASTGTVIAGPAGNDWYVGDSADNAPTAAGGGADFMYGAGGNDTLQGGSGNDILVGGSGNDTIYGNSDDDVILGGTGNDYLDGGSSVTKNTIIGGGGSDTMVGGSGADVFRFTGAQAGDTYSVDGGGSTDIIDLSEFSTATITNSGGVITVDRGGGNVFTITHSNVESIITAATVGNHGPLADAGPDQTVAMSASVTLTAAGSSDHDGNTLTYQWTQIEGPKVTLSSSTAASPTFTAPGSATTLQFVVVVSDGTTSHADTVTISVGAANVAPTISNLSGDSLSYTEGAGAVVIDQGSNALVADSDSANLDTGTLTVSIPVGAEPTEDVLGIRNQGTGAGQIGVSGSNVTYGGVTIGTFTGGAGGNNLAITFNSNATPTAVTALVKNITYEDINTDSPAEGSFTIRFALTDGDGGTSVNYDVSAWVSGVNDAPTDLSLSANQVAENAANGTVVGTVTGTDPDSGDTKSYSFTDNAGGRFAINSATGQITVANSSLLNYESATSHNVTVCVTDSGGLTYDETFTINLTNVNEAPVLADTALTLTVAEDAGAPSGAVGSLVSAITGGITDVDASASKGIAITGINETNGTWYYTTNGGTTWTAVGSVSNTSALLLADNGSTRLYFAPNADYNGTVSNGITFRAWDQTSGSNGTKVSLTTSNTVLDSMGSASFSNNNGTANWSSSWSESDASGSGASSGSIDVSSGYMRFRPTTVGNFIAREVDLSNATSATFSFSMPATFLSTGQILVQVSNDGGTTYTTLETITSASATGTHSYDISSYMTSNTQIRFYASATDSSGIRIDNVQVQYNTIGGGSSAYSTTSDTVAVTVTAVNDGPSFTSLNGTPTFTEGGSAVVLDSTVTITDTELTAANNFNGATLTLSRNGGANSQDVFSGSGTLSLSGGNVVVGGTTIGTYTNSSGTLAITFNSSATNTLVNQAMQQIAYSNSSDAPPSSVQVNWTFSDSNSGSQGSGGALTATGSVTVGITAVNDAPTDLSLSANTVTENASNGTVIGTVSGTDPDSGDTKTYNLTDSAGGRFAINSSTGVITVANSSLLNYESATSHNVTVRVTDSGGLTYDETFTINLSNVNEAPTGADATITITEDTSHTLTTANFGFSDVDAGDSLSAVRIDSLPGAGSLTLSGVNVTAGQVILVSDITAGNLVFTPAADASGSGYANITFSVRDSNNAFDTVPNTLTVNVTPVNDAPVITPLAPDVTFVEGGMAQVIDATGTITDVDSSNFDGGVMTVSISQNGSGDDRLLIGNFGTGPGQAGTSGSSVTYEGVVVGTFSGGTSGSDPLVITFNSNASQAAVQEVYRSVQFTNVSDTPSTATRQITVGLTDGDGGTATPQTKHVYVQATNDTPTDLSLSANTIAENAANGTVVGTVSGTDPDSGDTKTYNLTDSAGGRFAINSSTGAITVANSSLLNYESATSHNVTVRVTDSGGLTYDETFTINLTNVNETPTDLSLSANTVAENAANGTVVGTVSGVDPDAGDTKSYSFTDNAGGRFAINSGTGQITVADGALLNYESATSHTVTVRVTDSGGLTYDETFTINLTNVNEAPTGTNATITLNEDTAHTLTATNFGFSDVDAGDSLSAVRIDTIPGAGSLTLSGVTVTAGQVVAVADITAGNLVFTPAGDANGTGYASFTFSVRDGNNAYDAAPNTLTVNVTPVNDAPIAGDDTYTVQEDGTLTVDVSSGLLATDMEIDGDVSTVVLVTGPSNGVLSVNADGSFLYAPNANFTGTDTFTYKVNDGTVDSNIATVTITVLPVNDTPTDLSLSANTVAENAANGTVVGTVTGTDPDAGDTKTYSFTDSAGGRFAINNSTGVITVANSSLLNYESATSHNVTVRVTDGGGLTYDETFTINLTNVNEAPTGADATITITEDTSHTLTTANFGFSDVDAGDSLSAVRIDTIPGAGSLTLSGITVTAGQVILVSDITAGNLVFTPAADANGTGYANFTFSVRDNNNAYDSAPNTLTVNVTAVNDAPTLVTNTGSTVVEGGTDTIDVSELAVTDMDHAAAQLTYSIGTGPAHGRLELTTAPGVSATTFTQADIAANRLLYIHDGSETISDSFIFTVNDGVGGSLGATSVTLTVTPVNDTPTITSNGGGATAALTVAENVTAVTIVTGQDVDLPAQVLTYDISGGADQALFTIDATTGALHFTASRDFEAATDANGDNVYVVQVRVTDSQGASTTQAIQVTVTDVTEGLPPTSSTRPNTPPLPPSLVPTTPGAPMISGSSEPGTPTPVPSNPLPIEPTSRPISSPYHPTDSTPPLSVVPVERSTPIRIDDGKRIDGQFSDHQVPRWEDPAPLPAFTIIPVEPTPSLEPTPPDQPPTVSELLMAKLDDMTVSLEEAIGVDQEQHRIVARVTAVTGFVLSAGFVAWALRSSALLASCLATMPAWRHFDPLPVVKLTRRERQRRRDDATTNQRREEAEFDGLSRLFGQEPPLKP